MATRAAQLRWRHAHAASITVHLSARDAATLDQIAIEMYEENPHDPPSGVLAAEGLYPSRPAAVRELCRRWRVEHGKPPGRLQRLRAALSDFWRSETSWRRCTDPETRAARPIPPWLRALSRE
jgi:hypothetical protein